MARGASGSDASDFHDDCKMPPIDLRNTSSSQVVH